MSEGYFIRYCSPTLAGIKTANLFSYHFRDEKELQRTESCSLLKARGYAPEMPEQCIIQLIQRLADNGEFPHEIGLFLEYPPEDVYGFIENKAGGYKCVGDWKVYGATHGRCLI